MYRGLETPRTHILPAINNLSNPATKDTFRVRDAAEGVPYENGLLCVYEAFFGVSDVIHLERDRNDKLYGVDSGRHRIRVAVDAGWTAVPAKVADLSDEQV